MEFDDEIGKIQRKIADCPEGVARRMSAMEALAPQSGQALIDIGCGGGHLVKELAIAVGKNGRSVGLDPSSAQLQSAELLCENLGSVELMEGDATNMAFNDGEFDGLVTIQALEYIDNVDAAISECRRILKPGSNAAFISVMWDHWRFHGPDPVLNDRIHEIWKAHCPHQMLPLEMPSRLKKAGFTGISRKHIGFMNTALHENAFCFWASKLITSFAKSQGMSDSDADSWYEQLFVAEKEGRFGFVSIPVMTTAVSI